VDRASARLAEIDAALGRERTGEYGRCVVCAADIGAERLAARRSTDRCIACARAQ
jgi:RNA polymerase-binding transcription factor DksA